MYMCVHRERNRAAGHRQTPRCCPLNYTLSGCVLVAGPYRSSPDGSHPQREGDGCCFGPLKRRDGPCGAWTTASFRCRFSLPVSVFSSFIFFHSSGSNVPFYSSLLPSRFLLRGLASFCLLALEVQSNKKPLQPGTTPTLCLHSSH